MAANRSLLSLAGSLGDRCGAGTRRRGIQAKVLGPQVQQRVRMDLFSKAIPGDDVLAVLSSWWSGSFGSSAYGGLDRALELSCSLLSDASAAGARHAGGFFSAAGRPWNR